MIRSISASAVKAKPIDLPEFFEGLWRICGRQLERDARGPNGANMGLAVSGGVDSMALALLCSKIKSSKQPHANKIDFHAFVVDHGARAGSSEEAQDVANTLRGLDINARVLNMQWPENTIPSDLADFENQARNKRFQLLGKACSVWHIRYLCLAHHEDDQAETLLMRLAGGHTALGLQGMKPLAEVPECFGVYGVNQSGSPDTTVLQSNLKESRRGRFVVPFENGGVKIVRPLLEYSKERLKATCEHAQLSWLEDDTNADPSVTRRNAVRYMYKHHELPKALTKPYLLALSDRLRKRRVLTLSIAEKELVPRYSTSIEPASGMMHIWLPKPVDLDVMKGDDQLQKENYRQAHALFLRAALESVSPKREVSLPTLKIALPLVFPDVFAADERSLDTPSATTLGGVHIQRINSPSSLPKSTQQSSSAANLVSQKDHPDSDVTIWRLVRQPFPGPSKVSEPEPILVFPPRPNKGGIQKTQVLQHESGVVDQDARETASAWQLWDGRYWIRAVSLDGWSTIRVRHLRVEDMQSLKEFFEESSPAFRKLRHLLSDVAPGGIRYTLPTIVKVDRMDRERILVLPTLGYWLPRARREVEYEIRYKKIHPWFTAHAGSLEHETPPSAASS